MTDQTYHTMRCPHCQSSRVASLKQPTELGYRRLQCRTCRRVSNERTGTPFNFLEFPTDLVLLVVLWRLRYALSLRDIVELCLLRGVEQTHETVRDWEQRFAPYLIDAMKKRRQGQCSSRWHIDETYVKVKGQWVYLYRAIDRDNHLVDTMVSATRSNKAAIRCCKQALQTTGVKPTGVTTDQLASYRKAIRKACGRKVVHRTSKDMNNRIEHDHRGIKRRYGPTLGFKDFDCAAVWCAAVDEVRQLFRTRQTLKERISLAQGRQLFQQSVTDFQQFFLSCPVADAKRKQRVAA